MKAPLLTSGILVGGLILLLSYSCSSETAPPAPPPVSIEEEIPDPPAPPLPDFDLPLDYVAKCKPADGFDYPVGPPDAMHYYKYRGLLPGEHYGEDWNGKSGGNSDFGDLVFAAADGMVFYAQHYRPGWGTVIRMLHNVGTEESPEYVETLYAHLASNWVKPGIFLKRGDPLGTMGTAEGVYHAHLHFEMRSEPNMSIHWNEGADTSKFLDPTLFINAHRP